jgi:hypothetical protein
MATPSAKKLLGWAKKGDVDSLLGLCSAPGGDDDDEGDVDTEGDETAYKWLLVAGDFGHKKAASAAGDMLEWSSLRYDDGALLQGLIHLELGQAYLSGADGLPKDEKKARSHLAFAKKLEVQTTTDAAKGFPAFRKKVGDANAKIFSEYFPEKKKKK